MKLGLFLSVLFSVGTAFAEAPVCYVEAFAAATNNSDSSNSLIDGNVDLVTKEEAIDWLENQSSELSDGEIRNAVGLVSRPDVVVYNASYSSMGGSGSSLFVMSLRDCSLVREIHYFSE